MNRLARSICWSVCRGRCCLCLASLSEILGGWLDILHDPVPHEKPVSQPDPQNESTTLVKEAHSTSKLKDDTPQSRVTASRQAATESTVQPTEGNTKRSASIEAPTYDLRGVPEPVSNPAVNKDARDATRTLPRLLVDYGSESEDNSDVDTSINSMNRKRAVGDDGSDDMILTYEQKHVRDYFRQCEAQFLFLPGRTWDLLTSRFVSQVVVYMC